jgi:predicted NACHT family NTPase
VASGQSYDWKRFWRPTDGSINPADVGYLADPDQPYGRHLNPALRPFGQISDILCLALLGEPGIGKTETMRAERAAIDAAVAAEGGRTLWLDLRSCGSEQRLIDKLFGSPEFASWLEGDHRLHVFLDSLDECLLRVDTVAALLVDELRDHPVDRLCLRIGCRTAEWPSLLGEELPKLWPEGYGAYELAPLRRADVVAAATADGLDPAAFLRAVDEAGAVPLAIKPVTLDFLMGTYRTTGAFPTRQADLYLEGCRWLCEERNDSRVASRRTGSLTPDQRLAVAARIAAVTVFSNKYAVWTGPQPAASDEEDVLVRTLVGGTESVGEDAFAVGEDAVREALRTGLFSARGPEKLGWAHQTYAEFLAARYLMQAGVATRKAMALLVHPDDEEGRLVPQLHEAAAWLAGMSPEVYRRLTDVDPEVLLRSDAASTDAEDRATLVETLLKLYDEERLLDGGWAPRVRYERLEHPGLSEQLRPYVADRTKSLSARRVVLDIAETCELRTLQDVAARVALDPSEEPLVRKEAAHFVAVVGDGPTRARLMPLALGTAGDDPDDDLKGNGLRAVWPEHVGAGELFGMLAPSKNPNYMGVYEAFLTYDLTDRLRTEDLPAALAWVEGRDSDRGEHSRLGELADQIMQRAWAELPNPGVAPAFARAGLARLKRHEEVVKERREVFDATGEPAFSERVADDDRRRRLLLEEMIGLLEFEPEDARYLVSWKTALVVINDVGWLVERLRTESSDGKRAAIAALIGQTYRLWDDKTEELVYVAHLEDETLARQVGRFFAPVELGSEAAEEQRRWHEQFSRSEKEDEESAPPDPPVSARVLNALDDFEAGDVEAFWASVYELMQYDERGSGRASGAEWDMTGLPGWEAADDGTRARIVEAAKRYVLEGDPRTAEWFGKGVTYRPAFAGYRALCLLLRFAPEFLQGLPADVWEKWVPSILDFPVTLNTKEEKEPHLRLVAMAYDHAPDRLISTLLALVDQEDAKGHVFVTRSLERCWDDRLARAVLEKAKDPKLKARTVGVLLGDLLGHGLREARHYAEGLVSSGPRRDEVQLERAAVAAGVLFFSAGDCGWGVLWPAMQEDDGFADAVVDEVCSGARRSDLPFKHLAERQVADLYVWMARRYPRSEYFINWGNGMITYGRRENISEWRDEAVTHLRDRGTFEACRQIERVMVELPELRETLKWTLDAARAQARRRTWLPPTPEHVLALAARPKARLAEDVRRVARQEHCPIEELLGPPAKEGAHLEYKATFRTRAEEGKNGEPVGEVFKPLETASLKTIAAFLNSREGGTLLIGVKDDGSVYGLESDYASLRSEKKLDKNDRDLFGLHLNQAIINSVGMAAAANVSYEILRVGGEDLCRAHVRSSGFPVEARVTEVNKRGQHRKKVAFYGRFGNATRPVTDEAELERYKQQIWGP